MAFPLVMIATTAVPNHVRGALSRWMIEPVAGVYAGTMSARVRDELWSAVSASVGTGAALCVHPDDNEQGFTVRTAGSVVARLWTSTGFNLFNYRRWKVRNKRCRRSRKGGNEKITPCKVAGK